LRERMAQQLRVAMTRAARTLVQPLHAAGQNG
jgi:hypothetical protein